MPSPFMFWNYDASVRGWYVYGSGHVAPDARNIIPDPGVAIYEFTGAAMGSGKSAGGFGCTPGGCPLKSDPQTTEFQWAPIEVNPGGPFYDNTFSPSVGHKPDGTPMYARGSFGARMTILLHELAHKVQPPGFPDDALSLAQSEENTRTVIRHCQHAIEYIRFIFNAE